MKGPGCPHGVVLSGQGCSRKRRVRCERLPEDPIIVTAFYCKAFCKFNRPEGAEDGTAGLRRYRKRG